MRDDFENNKQIFFDSRGEMDGIVDMLYTNDEQQMVITHSCGNNAIGIADLLGIVGIKRSKNVSCT